MKCNHWVVVFTLLHRLLATPVSEDKNHRKKIPYVNHEFLFFNSASTSSCDVSPRRFHSASFTHRRLPSPKQPSPLVIDSSHGNLNQEFAAAATKKRASTGSKLPDKPETQTVSEPTTPFLLKPDISVSKETLNRAHRTRSTPPNIDLSKVSKLSAGIPKLELSGNYIFCVSIVADNNTSLHFLWNLWSVFILARHIIE